MANGSTVQFEEALLGAFSLDGLQRMLRQRLGMVLEQELDVHRGLKYIVTDLVALAIRDGWRDELMRGAVTENDRNPGLRRAVTTAGVDVTPPPAPPSPAAPLAADSPALEKIVRERGVFLKWQDFTRRLSALGRQICRIELPAGTGVGTGWLVGPDLMLTNYHVVEDLDKNRAAVADVACRFDYLADTPAGQPGGVACALSAAAWRVDLNPYAESDRRADAAEPTIDQLDYAVVRLARPIGDDVMPDGGGKRGWVSIAATPPVVMAEDILVVPQHPDGRALELAFGKALDYNGNGTRLRHDANTESGSSGSPCLTVSLDPFGLHHAGGPGRKLRYNQCVPLRQIVQRLTRQGIAPFWQA